MNNKRIFNKKNDIYLLFLLVFVSLVGIFVLGFPNPNCRTGDCGSDNENLLENNPIEMIGVWIGLLDMTNVVECSNLSDDLSVLHFSLVDHTGSNLGEKVVEVLPNGNVHIALDDYNIKNNYGTFSISNLDDSASEIQCSTMIYKKSSSNNKLEFAYSIPVNAPSQGKTKGSYNSFNLEQVKDAPTQNWLSIYNPGKESLNLDISVNLEDGTYDKNQSTRVSDLAAGARIDIPLGHQHGEQMGTYTIIPEDMQQPYGAFVSRYGYRSDNSYSFAFVLGSREGSCQPAPITASTMGPAKNWGEIVNPSNSTIDVEVLVKSRDNIELHKEIIRMLPFTQKHFNLNDYLGELNVGTLTARCVGDYANSSGILVQSLFYGHDTNDLTWAYAAQASDISKSSSSEITFSIDTNLRAANWLKILNVSSKSMDIKVSLFDPNGEKISLSRSIWRLENTLDIPLHEEIGYDFTGIVTVETLEEGDRITGELLRVFSSEENIDYNRIMKSSAGESVATIMRVPQARALRVEEDSESFSSNSSDSNSSDGNLSDSNSSDSNLSDSNSSESNSSDSNSSDSNSSDSNSSDSNSSDSNSSDSNTTASF